MIFFSSLGTSREMKLVSFINEMKSSATVMDVNMESLQEKNR